MRWTVRYSKQADKFLAKQPIDNLDSSISKAIKKVVFKEDTNIDVRKMKGQWKGYYRIKQGDLRIIFKLDVSNKIFFVYRIGWRGNVYK